MMHDTSCRLVLTSNMGWIDHVLSLPIPKHPQQCASTSTQEKLLHVAELDDCYYTTSIYVAHV
jgi:hypothetical protein